MRCILYVNDQHDYESHMSTNNHRSMSPAFYELDALYPEEIEGERYTIRPDHNLTVADETTVRDRMIVAGDIIEANMEGDEIIPIIKLRNSETNNIENKRTLLMLANLACLSIVFIIVLAAIMIFLESVVFKVR